MTKPETHQVQMAAHRAWQMQQDEIRRIRHARPGVYFIAAGNEMKIGHSAHPERRLRKLQTGHPQELKLVHVIYEPDERRRAALEGEMHRKFADQLVRAEWFEMALPWTYAYNLCRDECAPQVFSRRPRS